MGESISSDTVLVEVKGKDKNQNRILQFKIKAGPGTPGKDKLLKDLKDAIQTWANTDGITVEFNGPMDA